MKPYKNLSGKSGVVAYGIGPDFIDVEFSNGSRYRYSEASAGDDDIEEMKKCAAAGRGLSTFISQEQPPYEVQLR
jgi:hypothetical protein